MTSPTQGAWECRHGVDGRDWCEDCHAPEDGRREFPPAPAQVGLDGPFEMETPAAEDDRDSREDWFDDGTGQVLR